MWHYFLHHLLLVWFFFFLFYVYVDTRKLFPQFLSFYFSTAHIQSHNSTRDVVRILNFRGSSASVSIFVCIILVLENRFFSPALLRIKMYQWQYLASTTYLFLIRGRLTEAIFKSIKQNDLRCIRHTIYF